jgi:amylosucrase
VSAAGGKLVGFFTGNDHILGYQRFSGRSKVLVLCNFNDHPEHIQADRFTAVPARVTNLITGKQVEAKEFGLMMEPHQYAWLRYD